MIPEHLYRLHAAYMTGGFDAGAQMFTFYPTADRVFPILPDAERIEILPDTPAGSFGLAWFLGLTSDGRPRFAVRDDLVLTSKIAWHEAGHALEQVLCTRLAAQRGTDYYAAENDVRTRYWKWRGFNIHGTWWEWYLYAIARSASAGWAYLPGESIAEAVSAAVGGYVESEWTNTFGLDLALNNGIYDPSGGGMRSRVFWTALMQEVDMDEPQVRNIANAAAQEAVERYAAGAVEWGWKPIKDAFNDHKHKIVDPANPTTTGTPLVTLGNE